MIGLWVFILCVAFLLGGLYLLRDTAHMDTERFKEKAKTRANQKAHRIEPGSADSINPNDNETRPDIGPARNPDSGSDSSSDTGSVDGSGANGSNSSSD